MKQRVVEKMASQDAYEYGIAQMFFGPGAGTKRKLLDATIGDKIANIPGYEMAFEQASSQLNQTEMAEKAIALRKKIDRTNTAGKNLRAIKNGNVRGMSTGLAVVVVGGYYLHMTGYDKVILKEAKVQYASLKQKFKQGDVYIFNQNNPG